MNIENAVQGSLFARDFLTESISSLSDWQAVDDAALDEFEGALRAVFDRFPTDQTPNESQTEDDLIWPVLGALGWAASLRQQNLSSRGRDDVPDGLLFADEAVKDRANAFAEEWKRYEFGLAVVESKRWQRPLDRRSDRQGEETAPSTQMLRYLRRVDDLTNGALRWGVLTNGVKWRLYWAGARSVSEQFFELDLAAALNLPGHNEGLFALSEADRRHCLKLFMLFFRRAAFLPDPATADPRSLHERALDQGRFYEERVAADLSELVFKQVFPKLARAIAEAVPDAPLPEVRDAALILLYRLLFILYAEDRDLLPVRDSRYDDYSLRKVRGDVERRKSQNDTFSASATLYWSTIGNLCRLIDQGDASIGLPPYNGGLFDQQRTPLLGTIQLDDEVIADVIDALSFEQTEDGRRYINYRDLSVQQLGSIYERLIEHEVVRDNGQITVRLNVFARKDSGSYYTPADLVGLIVRETVDPLVQARLDMFTDTVAKYARSRVSDGFKRKALKRVDPAEQLLELKICDPAMGSGPFLVGLVDYLADRVIAAMAEAEAVTDGYVSPLTNRIDDIRTRILTNAREHEWTIDKEQLDDRHIVRRMVLKRCVYGVDKNPMAVELAKVSLWLHTFTVGAPLSFLDHHLRCGDSLFGCWARQGIEKASEQDQGLLFMHEPVNRAAQAADAMQVIELLTDAEIVETQQSAQTFVEVEEMTAPLDGFLSLLHAFDWLDVRNRANRAALRSFFKGRLGDPIDLALGRREVSPADPEAERFAGLLERARRLVAEERFLNWEAAFPGVWSDLRSPVRKGGFDAVIGNPPWDRIKLQQVEWFAARRPAIALAQRAADRKHMIAALKEEGDPLSRDFDRASERAASAARMVRTCGDYPLLSRGDVNLYSLFVERAMTLVKPKGMVGLLVPSGIASDKTAAVFFQGVATAGKLKALYDFENKKVFFPDVHASFKFCVFVASPSPVEDPANCAFYLHSIAELNDGDRCFPLTAEDFARVNPNTGTAPIFRTSRDAKLTTAIYERLPVLVDRSGGEEVKAWPVKYSTMFHMANDSGLFRTPEELEEREGAWSIGGNRFDSPSGEWVPLYEGKMVQAFDHRASDTTLNQENLFRPGQQEAIPVSEKTDFSRSPKPRYYVIDDAARWSWQSQWVIAFKDITAATNMRTMISAIIPRAGAGHTLPVLPFFAGAR